MPGTRCAVLSQNTQRSGEHNCASAPQTTLEFQRKQKCGGQKMRCNSQFLRSMNSFVDKTESMKAPVMLLLTSDNELEEAVADALSEIGGISHLTRDAGDALETICGVNDLDVAIIDFEHGPHG